MMWFVLAGAMGAGAWARIRRMLRPPPVPPEFAGPRPEPAPSGYVSHTESVRIYVPVEHYLRWVTATRWTSVTWCKAPRGCRASSVHTS
jgi:hypothetical protein